jgi:ribosomal protein S18 acetylase RimI-like enzyme
VLPWITGNSLLGLDLEGSLVGFVDVSLQPQSMAALEWTPLAKRKALHGDALRPYLCNLLVDPRHRKRGYGKRLVRACLDTSRDWGYAGELFLHVEPSDRPAVALCNSLGFTAVKNEQHTTLMTRKKTA